MLGTMRCRITIKTPTVMTDAGGGSSMDYDAGYVVWAKVDNRTGAANYQQSQRQANYDYRFTVRYDSARLITVDKLVQYKSRLLRIDSVQIEDEGKQTFVVLNCSFHGGT